MQVEISLISYMDDSEIKPGEDERFIYTMNTPFIQIIYKGEIKELINIQVVRSMEVIPPPKKCKWCQQLTKSTPCNNCGK